MRSGLESLLPPLEICQIYSRRVRGWRGLHQRVQGFSLMEVLVAGSILVLAIIPMIEVFIRAGRSLSAAGEHSQALFLSQMVVKDMQARHEKNPLLILETVESSSASRNPCGFPEHTGR